MLDRMRRCRARELEVLLPLGIGIDQIRIDVGTVKDVAGAVGVDDQALGDIERRQEPLVLGFVVPEETFRPHGDAADAAPAGAQMTIFSSPIGKWSVRKVMSI